MTRPNDFPKAVKVAARLRATDMHGEVHCDGCGAIIRRHRVDHIRAAGLLGPPTLANAQVLGVCCWAEKDTTDNAWVKRAKRVEAKHLGVRAPPKMQSRGFAPRPPKPSPCRPTSKTLPRGPIRGSRA
jgi:hypothetical protein